MCAGFVVLNLRKLPEIWNASDDASMTLQFIGDQVQAQPNDQQILRAANFTHPERVGIFPKRWDGHVADGLWRYPNDLLKHRPELAMLHFNGGGHSKDNEGPYFDTHYLLVGGTFGKKPEQKHDVHLDTYGLIQEQVRLPWPWARARVQSLVRPDNVSYPLQLIYEDPTKQREQEERGGKLPSASTKELIELAKQFDIIKKTTR